MLKVMLISALAFLSVAASYGSNHPIIKTETSTDSVAITENFSKTVTQQVETLIGVGKIDEDKLKIDLNTFIDTQGATKNWTPQIIQAMKDKAKDRLIEKIVVVAKDYNTKVDAFAVALNASLKSVINAPSPKLVEKGDYRYEEGMRDPGHPGWSENYGIIEGFTDIGSDINLSISLPIDISASLDPKLFGSSLGEIKIATSFTVSVTGKATYTAVLEPVGSITISDVNKPTTKIERDVRLRWTGDIDISGSQAILDIGAKVNIGGSYIIKGLKLDWVATPL